MRFLKEVYGHMFHEHENLTYFLKQHFVIILGR